MVCPVHFQSAHTQTQRRVSLSIWKDCKELMTLVGRERVRGG